MKKIKSIKYIFVTILMISSSFLNAQKNNVTIEEDKEFGKILNEKRKLNSAITINDRYKIQIYSGDNDTAKKILSEIRKDSKMLDATILFTTPNYRVVVGNYKTKIEAEKALLDFQKRYTTALIIKPNK